MQFIVEYSSTLLECINVGDLRLSFDYSAQQLFVSVSDSGIGITKDQQSLLLSEFTQADISRLTLF